MPPASPEPEQSGMDGGFRGDLPADSIPPDAASSLSDIEFNLHGIRRGPGYAAIGLAATSRILGLADYKYISGDAISQRVARFFRDANGKLIAQLWDGAAWTEAGRSASVFDDKLLSVIATQGSIVVANGKDIYRLAETREIFDQADDFPAGNLLKAANEVTVATLDPAGARFNEYSIYYRVQITGMSADGVTVTIGFEHNGAELTNEVFFAPASSDPTAVVLFDDQNQVLQQVAALNDTFGIRIKSIVGTEHPNASKTEPLDDPPTVGFDIEGIKSTTDEAKDDTYTFVFDAQLSAEVSATQDYTATFGLYIDILDGNGLVQRGTVIVNVLNGQSTLVLDVTKAVVVDGVVLNSKFAVKVESSNTSSQAKNGEVTWIIAGFTVAVKGYNKAVDANPFSGVEYQTEGDLITVFELISVDAPKASYLLPFAERVLALRNGDDPQVLSWTIRGGITDWIGVGSGQIFPIDTRADPVDELMAAAVIGQNIGALFRRRSIMRILETGNVLQAVGVVHWIDYMGTDAPHSVRGVEQGAIFLGHDRIVYYLTLGGLQPIGIPVRERFEELPEDRLSWVDSAYNPLTREYIIGMPFGHPTHATELWIFELGSFITEQAVRWRKLGIETERLGVVSDI
jgi:hypothetical protein